MKKKNQKVKIVEEAVLIRQTKKGSREAYQEMVKRYQKKLFSYLYGLVRNKEETEDLLQNVFVKAYKNIKSFDESKMFSPWIYRISHNEAINFLKKRDRKRFVSWEDITISKDKLETQSEERSPFESWIKKESGMRINEALDKLPEKYRRVLLLRYFQEKSYEEIAKEIKNPVNTVGTFINRAKKKLLKAANFERRLDYLK